MKKNILKLLITISLIFSFAPVSKAVFNNSICTTINKTSCARSNGFNTVASICTPTWDGEFYNVYQGDTYHRVKTELRRGHFTQITDSSGKGSITVKYYYCGGENSNDYRISASVSLTAKAYQTADVYSLTAHSKVRPAISHSCSNFNNAGSSECGRHAGCTRTSKGCTGTYYTYGNYICESRYRQGNDGYCYERCKTGYTWNGTNKCIKCPDKMTYSESNNRCEYEEPYDVEYTEREKAKVSEQKLKDNAVAKCAEDLAKIIPDAYFYLCHVENYSYNLDCKEYNCVYTNKTIGVNTPSFEVNGKPAYCVNPSKGFNNSSNNYEVDNTFDATNCKNSYSTVDCGYANILIEAEYHNRKNNANIGAKAIELAMRLWGAHSKNDESGFDGVGISTYVGDGDSCIPNVAFRSGTENLYVKTEGYIWSKYMNSLKSRDYIDVRQAESLFSEITCTNTNDMLSLVCGSSRVYKQAFALFFNTVFGNKYMQQHLDELFGNEVNTRPNDVNVETDEKETTVVLTFDRTVTNTTRVEYDCNEIEKDSKLSEDKRKYKGLSDADRNHILQYCSVKTEFCIVNSSGDCEPITVYDNDKIYDASKGQIKVKTKYFSACTWENQSRYRNYRITVTYNKTKKGGSVKKYIACGNISGNQFLYALLGVEGGSGQSSSTTDTKDQATAEFNASINCSGTCTDYDTKVKTPKCQDKDNTAYTGYVRDPSLKCIVNMYSETNKSYYDYSDYFKVNTNLCRVYCSDEVNYYLADKLTVDSGRYFVYDIKPGGLAENKNYKISSIIEEKRNCVSEIYFDKSFPTAVDWEKIYGLTASEIDKALDPGNNIKEQQTINNIKDLLRVLFAKAKTENGRDENINQVIYDLYNCNFYNSIPVRQPKDDKIGNLYQLLNNLYNKEHNYGLTNTTTNEITYVGGAEYYNRTQTTGEPYTVGTSGSDIKMTKNLPKNNESIKITYCTNCLNYDKTASQDANYSYTGFGNSSEKTIREWLGNMSVPSRLNSIYNTRIPGNNYAKFETSIQMDFYNDSKFQAQAYTGKIRDKINDNSGDFADLEDYAFPLSKNAYNKYTETKGCTKINEQITRCNVTQTIKNMATYFRNKPMDSFNKYITSTDFTTFTCHIDVKVPKVSPDNNASEINRGGNLMYRNVDLSNLFPNDLSKNSNSNWQTEVGKIATNEIQKSSSSMTTNKYLEYSFDLTPQSIKNIRTYNTQMEAQGGYLNNTLKGCTEQDGKFFNCESSFLNEIRGRNSLYVNNNSSNNKFDGVSEYTQSLKKK